MKRCRLDTHIEVREGFRVSLTALYELYIDMCSEKQINNALEEHPFCKVGHFFSHHTRNIRFSTLALHHMNATLKCIVAAALLSYTVCFDG